MKKPIAEFIGMFTLVMFGCGAAVGAAANPTALAQVWLFIVAPLIGAGAGLLFKSGVLAADED